MANEEDVRLELEAVEAVYGDDCWIIDEFPPHINLHIKPRTADDESQQFVEVTIGVKLTAQYPDESPQVYIVEEKGLDDKRQTHLISSIQNKASELSSCLMLVALCEEAVETLSNMNHPDGDCPLCLYPLMTDDSSGLSLPFMKLMSCYHCFHCDCIMRLWNWLQEQNGTKKMNPVEDTSAGSMVTQRGTRTGETQHKVEGNCPVCRKVFDAKDFGHVLDYVGSDSSHSHSAGVDTNEDIKAFLQSDPENERRQKFEAALKLQEENSGLIEPKKDLAILPGMFLPETSSSMSTLCAEPSGDHCADNPSDSTLELSLDGPQKKITTSKQKNMGMGRKGPANSMRRQPQAPAHNTRQHPQAPAHNTRQHPQAPAHNTRHHPQAPAHNTRQHPQAPAHNTRQHPQAPAQNMRTQPQDPAHNTRRQPPAPVHNMRKQPQATSQNTRRQPEGQISNQQWVKKENAPEL